MDGFCVPFSVKKESEFPAISAYGSYGGGFLFFDSENHRILSASIPGVGDYMGIRLLKVYVIMVLNGVTRSLYPRIQCQTNLICLIRT